ncbi:pilin [Neisseria gonorrhoeae]|uniref:pilin n=1 Tax=Neisseria gonorrhoeae TaxID=485 RepID=UPI0012AC5788|nr:pilin [Neisseria gonorrhoeae]
MPSEPSDGIFNRPPFTGAGRARGNTRTVIPDNTAISKPVIPAQAEIRTCPHGNLSDKTVAQTPRPRFPLPWE